MTQKMARVSLLSVVLALAGCGNQVQPGQIFVATRGGQNVKLGAVEILAFDEATINAFIKQRQAEIAQQRAKLKLEADAAQSEVEKVEEPYNRAIRENIDTRKRYYDQEEVVRRETKKAEELGESYKSAAFRVMQLSNSVAQAEQRAVYVRTNAEAQHKNDDEAVRRSFMKMADQDVKMIVAQQRQYQASLDELLPKHNELNRQMTEQTALLQAEKQKLQPIEAELQEKQKAAKDADDLQIDAGRRLDDAKQALARFDVTGILFKDLPQPAARTVSDAEGRFRLELPSGGRFAVYAHAQRTVEQMEKYLWLIWAGGKGDLLLNNANMFGSRSADQVAPTDLW